MPREYVSLCSWAALSGLIAEPLLVIKVGGQTPSRDLASGATLVRPH